MLTQRRTAIATRGEQPTAVAGRAWARLMHGETPLGRSALSVGAGLESITLDEVRRFHSRGAHASGARLALAGPRSQTELAALAKRLLARLPAAKRDAHVLSTQARGSPAPGRVFLVDHPGAQQTELRIGQLSVPSTHTEFFPLAVLNFILGGSFSSRINLNLREAKGFTYGSRSSFAGGVLPGEFTVSAAVETSVSAPAAREVLRELSLIREGVRGEELAFAQAALRESLTTQYESCEARRALIDRALKFDWPADYPLRRVRQLEGLTLADLDRLAHEFLDPAAWIVLAVGDASAIGDSLEELGLGAVQRLDIDGRLLQS